MNLGLSLQILMPKGFDIFMVKNFLDISSLKICFIYLINLINFFITNLVWKNSYPIEIPYEY